MTDAQVIDCKGIRVHNLQGIDVEVPLRRLTVVSGVSGAGKSSLVFDTLYAEAQRRYLQSFSPYVRQFLERFDRPDVETIGPLPPAIAIGQRSEATNSRATVGTLTEIVDYLRLIFVRRGVVTCARCGQVVRAQHANDVLVALAELPVGTRATIAFPSRPEDPKDVAGWAAGLQEEGFIRVQIGSRVVRLGVDELPRVGAEESIRVLVDRIEAGRTLSDRLTDSIETAFARGQGRLSLLTENGERLFDRRFVCPRCDLVYLEPGPRLLDFNDPLGACSLCHGTGKQPKSNQPCATCHGTRLNEQALSVRLNGHTLAELCGWSGLDLARFMNELPRDDQAGDHLLLEEVKKRLAFLKAVELGYLSLDRAAATLSTGEARRVRLTAALGASLVQAMYLIDEPTAGLHPRDTSKIITELRRFRDAGNTLIVVEHNLDVIRQADHVIDLGPGAGEEGGRLLYTGPPSGLTASSESVTAEFLRDKDAIPVPEKRRPLVHGSLSIQGA